MTPTQRKLIVGAWITTVSLVLLTTAAYAWMTIATSLKVSDLELNIITDNAMEITLDVQGEPSEDWTTVLSLGDLLKDKTTLRPVTWSAKRDSFLAPRYGLDGRPSFDDPILLEPEMIDITDPSSDEAEEGEGDGYMIALDLWMRTGSSEASVLLSEPAETSEGQMGAGTYVIGEPVWDPDAIAHINGGLGAERVVRMAFRSYDEDYAEGGFVIYEPNTDEDEPPTLSVDGTNLEGDGRVVRQTRSTWAEQTPVLHGSVDYTMGELYTDAEDGDMSLFTLKSGVPRRFTIYIWLEGQDPECVNAISGAKLLANIQFTAMTGDDHENIYRPWEAVQ